MILGIRGWYSTHERPFNCIDTRRNFSAARKWIIMTVLTFMIILT